MKTIKIRTFLLLSILLFSSLNFSAYAQNRKKTKEVNILKFEKKSKSAHEMIQNAIDYAFSNNINVVLIPDGEYSIDLTNKKGILLKDNIHLKLSANAVLKAEPTNLGNYSIVRIHKAKNVKLSGGKIIGERYEHTGKGGEWGMGVDIKDAVNINVSDIYVSDCWGDGIYIAGDSKNISISNVISDNNRRQGMSVIKVDDLFVQNSLFTNTNGTPPEAGIDLEPNEGDYVNNVIIENCKFTNNIGLGLHMYGKFGSVTNVVARNCVVDNNPIGVSLRYPGVNNVELSNINISNSLIQGLRIFQGSKDVKASNVVITESAKNAITLSDASNVELTNFKVKNYEQGVFVEKSDTIKLSSFTLNSDVKSAVGVDMLHSKDITMDNFDISDGKIGVDVKYVNRYSLSNSKFLNQKDNVLYLLHAYNGVIKDNRIEEAEKTPIWMICSDKNKIENNSFVDNTYLKDNTFPLIHIDVGSNKNEIKDNTITSGKFDNRNNYIFKLEKFSSYNTIKNSNVDAKAYRTALYDNKGEENTIQ